MPALVLTVRFHDGAYHGVPDWPPSPARLFQALVAAMARGAAIGVEDRAALEWLEELDAPAIAAPHARRGSPVKHWVPNNDLDARGGDPARVAEIRTAKTVQPWRFDLATPFLYAWVIPEGQNNDAHAARIIAGAERLYQLGRGVDMAWATGEQLTDAEAEKALAAHQGVVRRPTPGAGGGAMLAAPTPGTLKSLERRFDAFGGRFLHHFERRKPDKKNPNPHKYAGTTFAQPPRPRTRQVAYDAPATRLLFDIAYDAEGQPYAPASDIVAFTEIVRDAAAARLRHSAWRRDSETRDRLIDAIIVGKDAGPADKARRIRITPLPSIGHRHADQALRRVLVEVPPECPIPADTIAWSFAGPLIDGDGVLVEPSCALTPADERKMLTHYGVEGQHEARVWRTVTPVALPQGVARRRIDPERLAKERASAQRGQSLSADVVKSGGARATEDNRATGAFMQALRHAGVAAKPVDVRVQREPFDAKGARAEAFAAGSRFSKHQLWHVEATFGEPISGPLVIGDGRYVGLGLMAPHDVEPGLRAYRVTAGRVDGADGPVLAKALRRAVMARLRADMGGDAGLRAYVTGHEADGAPLRRGQRAHLAFAADPHRGLLIIIAPHLLERQAPTQQERKHLRALDRAMRGFSTLSVRAVGLLSVEAATLCDDDPLWARSTSWATLTDYRLTRHVKQVEPADAVRLDVLVECARRRLPRPVVSNVQPRVGPRGGVTASFTLTFDVATPGPMLLGAQAQQGGGLMTAVRP